MRIRIACRVAAAAILLVALGSQKAICQANPTPPALAPAPDIRVDFFGAEKGYAIGANDVTMLCVLRNVGRAALPANALRVRCYALAGLDYTDGELTPLVPPLMQQQAVAFRWRLQPTDPKAALVASVLLTKVEDKPVSGPGVSPASTSSAISADPRNVQPISYIPKAVLAVVPHIAGSTPDIFGFTAPAAVSGATSARIGNDRLSLTIAHVSGNGAVGLLAAKSLAGWDYVGVAWPLAQIRTSIDGQSPWWNSFRWTHSESHSEPGSASLDLFGLCGDVWEAQITIETHKDSGILAGRLRLKARKTCRLFGVQLPRLISPSDRTHPVPSSDGSASLVITNPTGDVSDNLAAVHKGLVTSGLAWTAHAPVTDWLAIPLPPGDMDHTEQLGVQWVGGDHGEVVLPGGIIDFNFRLFCLSPGDSVRDAHRFAMP